MPEFDWEKLGRKVKRGVRNLNTTTVAPTGSVSLIAGCSSGIEPIFLPEITRSDSFGKRDLPMHPLLADHFDGEIPGHFRSTFDVSPEEHVKMQAVFQRWIQSAISKTVNLPEGATREDVKKIYTLAHSLGCKGITVYRHNSRKDQVLSAKRAPVVSRGVVLEGATEKVKWDGRKVYVTLNTDKDGRPVETFVTIGKSGTELHGLSECLGKLTSLACKYSVSFDKVISAYLREEVDIDPALGLVEYVNLLLGSDPDLIVVVHTVQRLINVMLDHKVPLRDIVKQLKGIGSDKVQFSRGERYDSLPDVIGKSLERLAKIRVEQSHYRLRWRCPDCDGEIRFESGCLVCFDVSCGWTACG